jgi:thiamine kinase-like enzyme
MKILGEGISAVVYSDGKYAYKKYKDHYDLENMKFETRVQNEIYYKTDLDVAYYEIVDNQIRMTLFEGKTLADRLIEDNYVEGLQDFIQLQLESFQFSNLKLADSFETFAFQIQETKEEKTLKDKALESLQKTEKKLQLCHFDYHPKNIVYHNDIPHIIDWTNAKLGNPVMDVASTYIIFSLYAKDYAIPYLETMKSHGFDVKEVETAVPLMAFIRYRETQDESLREILKSLILRPNIVI